MIALPWEGDWPITQLFGNPAPLYSQWGLAGHNGLDVGMPVGTPLRAWKEITIVEVEDDPGGYGYYFKGRTQEGEDLLYAHLSLWGLPIPGRVYVPGERVAFSGSSGMSTGPHLHLGYRPVWWVRGWPHNGYSDPLPLLTDG